LFRTVIELVLTRFISCFIYFETHVVCTTLRFIKACITIYTNFMNLYCRFENPYKYLCYCLPFNTFCETICIHTLLGIWKVISCIWNGLLRNMRKCFRLLWCPYIWNWICSNIVLRKVRTIGQHSGWMCFLFYETLLFLRTLAFAKSITTIF
jgi:hypothetical protein